MREMDLVLGRFADNALAGLSDGELAELERWLEIPDQQMFAYVIGTEPAPPEIDTALFRRLRKFHGSIQ
jgi:antitoxin CptB